MRSAFVLPLLLLAVLGSPLCAADLTAEEKKLVGEWRYEDKQQEITALHIFRENGTHTAELRQRGELKRRFEGLWRLDDDMIVYTYTSDSLEQIPTGAVERDKLVRVTESSYTIEAGDHQHRTYFRVKEER